MLASLQTCGVRRTSLLVIPNHHHVAPMWEDAAYCGWLKSQAANGHEAVLHGYYHQRDRSATDGMKRLVTEVYTAGEGEFFDLSEREATRRLAEGRLRLLSLGIEPEGFIAPAWLLGSDAARAVRSNGFGYTTRIDRIEDFVSGRDHWSQSLCYSVRAAWRRICSLCWNSALLALLERKPLLRIGLHPPDWDHLAIRRHAEASVRRALAGREAMPYETWLERQRTLDAAR